jgi:hypothetical protein
MVVTVLAVVADANRDVDFALSDDISSVPSDDGSPGPSCANALILNAKIPNKTTTAERRELQQKFLLMNAFIYC